MLKFLRFLFKDLFLFVGAYSNNSFKEPLSKEEEEEYIKRFNMGDKEARNKLIEHNLRLVVNILPHLLSLSLLQISELATEKL